jgi:hypothetical protein
MLGTDLQNYHQQFLSIRSEARNLLADLTDNQLTWQPGSNQWSIAQCVDHLVVTGCNSLSHMTQAISEARLKGLLSEGPFRYGMLERWFVRQMEPNAKMRFKAPKAYLPIRDRLPSEIVTSFYGLQEDFLQCIEDANGINLSRVRVNNAVSRWFRLSLGQELAFNIAHERRHLWQAEKVKEIADFPQR